MTTRRTFLALVGSGLLLAAFAGTPTATVWRFEANGWPRDRLHAIDLPYPLARDEDGKAQPGRTSTGAHMAFLKTEVEEVMIKRMEDGVRPTSAEFNSERIMGRTRPATDNHLVVLELAY